MLFLMRWREIMRPGAEVGEATSPIKPNHPSDADQLRRESERQAGVQQQSCDDDGWRGKILGGKRDRQR
jgi:hypothetical protein